MSKLVDSRYVTEEVQWSLLMDSMWFTQEKEEPEVSGQVCGREVEGPKGGRGLAGDTSGREGRGFQQAERHAGQV